MEFKLLNSIGGVPVSGEATQGVDGSFVVVVVFVIC